MKVQDYCSNVRAVAFPDSVVSCDDTQLGFRFFGGLQFTKHFGVEAGYSLASGFSHSEAWQSGGQSYRESAESDYSAIHFALTGAFPLSDKIGATAKVGMHKWENEGTVIFSDGSTFSGKVDDTDPLFGVGIKARVTDRFIISGEATRFKGDGFDADAFSLNAAYAF